MWIFFLGDILFSSMTTKITVDNFGTFFIDTDKVQELIAWLMANYSHPSLGEVNSSVSSGNQIING
jgi:hypothetical protein